MRGALNRRGVDDARLAERAVHRAAIGDLHQALGLFGVERPFQVNAAGDGELAVVSSAPVALDLDVFERPRLALRVEAECEGGAVSERSENPLERLGPEVFSFGRLLVGGELVRADDDVLSELGVRLDRNLGGVHWSAGLGVTVRACNLMLAISNVGVQQSDANPRQMLIVHLSDIHFRANDGDPLDPNAELRRELCGDLRRLRTELDRPFDALAISGDIAFSGKEQEFVVARSWIKTLCELIDCPSSGVMVAPGNHDVDRDVVTGSPELLAFQQEMRTSPLLGVDDRLARALRDATLGERVMSSLTEYSKFAHFYGCGCNRQQPWWEKHLSLERRRTVTFRGLNTVLISGPSDNQENGRLVLGTVQASLDRDLGHINIVIGHHPPSWLRDQDSAERMLAARAALQLFGHRHEQWIDQLNNSVRLFAGAVHPDRTEGNWVPRYNVIELALTTDEELRIRIWPRRWYPDEATFGPDNDSQLRVTRDLTHVLRPLVGRTGHSPGAQDERVLDG